MLKKLVIFFYSQKEVFFGNALILKSNRRTFLWNIFMVRDNLSRTDRFAEVSKLIREISGINEK